MEKETAIIRVTGEGEIALFFPEDQINRGCIEAWYYDPETRAGYHCETGLSYYLGTHQPKAENEPAVAEAIAVFEKHYETKIERLRRINYDTLAQSWR